MTLTNSRASHQVAMAVEDSPGVAETDDVYRILVEEGSGLIKTDREFDMYKSSYYNRPTMSIAKAYKGSVDINTWGFYGTNGTGYLLASALGASTPTTPDGGTNSRLHTITFTDTILPSYTIWDTTLNTAQKMAGCQCNTLAISCPQNGPIALSANYLGCAVTTNSDTLNATYMDEEDITMAISASQNSITYGVDTSTITDLTFNIDNGINQDEGIVQGGKYPATILVGNDRKVTGSFDAWDLDGENLLAFWEGSTSTPTATTPAERPTYVSLQSTWTGALIEGSLYNYLDIAVPSIQLTGVTPSDSDNRLKYTVEWEAVKSSATPITILLQNIETVNYSTHA